MRNDHVETTHADETNEDILISVDTVGKVVIGTEAGPVIVSRAEKTLMVTGWAVDKRAKNVFEKIYVCLDGRSYQVTTVVKRLDVADRLKNSKYKYSGYCLEIPMEEITFGWHRVSIKLVRSDNTIIQGLSPIWIFRQEKPKGVGQLLLFEMWQFLKNPAQFIQRIRAALNHIFRQGFRSFWEGYLKRMYRVPDNVQVKVQAPPASVIKETILISIDSIGKSIVASVVQPIIVSGNERFLLVSGWAVDVCANGPFKEVYVCLDETPYAATYGISRWDVAKHLMYTNYISSGFRAEIPLEGIKSGQHVISITVVTWDGTKMQGLSQVWIFRQGKKRDFAQLVIFELHRLRTNPERFLERAMAATKHIFRYGLWSFWHDYLNRMYRVSDGVGNYKDWILRNELPENWEKQRSIRFKEEPLISIIVPVYETQEAMLTAMIRSVIDQTYPHWELCIAEGASRSKHIRKVLKSFEAKDRRIKIVYLTENQGISGNSNAAIALASGDYIAFLDHDDLLNPDSLFEMVRAINEHDDVDVLYSDEDNISSDGKLRMMPFFKPDYSPDTLRTGNYISHFLVIRKSLGDKLGWLRSQFDGAQDFDMVLRASEKARRIIHVPKVLYHFRSHARSTASGLDIKSYAKLAGKQALQEHLKRIGLCGEIEEEGDLYIYKVNYLINVQPLISIIIPNKDQADVLESCLNSVLDKSTYKNFEIMIIENNSQQKNTFALYKKICRDRRVKVVGWDKPFNFSALNNFAVTSANGEVLLFLNNDTEIINPDWLERMLQYALRPDVGAVGAKLYYPDNTLQHAGVIVGLGGVAGHVLKHQARDQAGEFSRLKRVQNYSAVTAACLMMRREVFNEVGGFNEDLAVAFNDVDLCLKIREKGYFIVWTPYAELFHHESKSRGYENTSKKIERFGREINTFKDRWSAILIQGDPFYNPNLTLDAEDFTIRSV